MYSCTCFNKWLHMHLIFQAKLGVARDFCTLVVKVEVCLGVGSLKRNKDIHRILIDRSIYRCFWRIPADNSLFCWGPTEKNGGGTRTCIKLPFYGQLNKWSPSLSITHTHKHTNPHGGGGDWLRSHRLIVILYIVHLHTPAVIYTQIK